MYNWVRVMSNEIAIHVHEMAKHNNNSYRVKDGIAVHEMAQSQGKQFSMRSNESASDEMA